VLEIKVNPEYEKILPKLSGEEFEALKASIQNDGQLYPIIINQKGVILDGHNRYHVCVELKFAPKTFTMPFDDPLVEKKFVIEVNLKRRHLNLFQKAEMGILLMDIEKAIAKTRQGKPSAQLGGKSGDARDIVSQRIGVGRGTFERAQKVIASANEETKDKLRKGEWSINYAYEGYKAIDNVSDKVKKKVLKLAFEKEEINPIQLNDITKKTELAQELIESRAPKDKREALTAKYVGQLYTPELNIGRLEEDLKVVGGLTELEEREVSQDILKTKPEAEKFAKECGGFLIGETRYWKMKIDPYKYKAEKVGES
jgi:ParB-like chromosome segregation protein Spo0J